MNKGELWQGPIVDAHHHLWDPVNNYHPWLSDAALIPFRYGDYSAIKRPYLAEHYRADSIAHNVQEAVYVETEWNPADPVGETRYITDLHVRSGLPSAIVAQAMLDKPDAARVIAEQAAFSLVRSVRHKPGGPSSPDQVGDSYSLMSDSTWQQGYAQLAVYGLHFDLQTAWWNLHEAQRLATDFPDTNIILNHTGLPADRSQPALQAWHDAMSQLAEAPNVFVKISGLGLPGRPWLIDDNRWIVRETIAMFGTQRAMFGSNFPVDSLCASFDTIYSGFKQIVMDFTMEQQRQLFYENARALYKTGQARMALTYAEFDVNIS